MEVFLTFFVYFVGLRGWHFAEGQEEEARFPTALVLQKEGEAMRKIVI